MWSLDRRYTGIGAMQSKSLVPWRNMPQAADVRNFFGTLRSSSLLMLIDIPSFLHCQSFRQCYYT